MCQPGGGRWALGFGDRKHRRTAVETRSAAALGQQVLCCRWSARGSIKRAPANSQRPPACITTNQQPLGRAKSADGPASAASHRSNMAFLSTRTSTPPGRGPVNKGQLQVLRKPALPVEARFANRVVASPSGSCAPTRPPPRGRTFRSSPRPHVGSPSWLEPLSCGPPRVCPCQRPVRWIGPLDLRPSAGSCRWIYPLDLSVDLGSPRSVSRTRCTHPRVGPAWTEVSCVPALL